MSFIRLKNNGGLVMPSASVVHIIHIAERKLRLLTLPGDKPMHALSGMGSKLEAYVLHEVGNVHALFGNTSHITNTADGIDNHVFSVVRQIVRFYLHIRKFHLAKIWNINEKAHLLDSR